MKTLTNYTQQAISAALEKNGAFFAFSQSQFDEQARTGVRYSSLGSGLVCPEKNAIVLMDALEEAHSIGIARDIEENGISAIILRELLNYEAFYTCDFSDAIVALEGYEVNRQHVIDVFNENFYKYA